MSDEDAPTFTPPHPAIPSRARPATAAYPDLNDAAHALPAPMFDDPVLTRQLLPRRSKPKRKKVVKKATKVQVVNRALRATGKNPARSAAAQEAWKTRRARLGNASPTSRDELRVLVQMMTLMERLPAGKRTAVLKILQGLVS